MGQVSATLRANRAAKNDPHKDSSHHSAHSYISVEDMQNLESIITDEQEEEGSEEAVRSAQNYIRATQSNQGLDTGATDRGTDLKNAEETKNGQKGSSKNDTGKRFAAARTSAKSLRTDAGANAAGNPGPLKSYFLKMRGDADKVGPYPHPLNIALGWIGAFSSILIIAVLKQWATPGSRFDFLVASFGASAVLVFGAPEGKLSQPRNLVGGQVVSAVTGCIVRLILKDVLWLSSAVGMACALTVMQLTKTLHPPGGATALIAASTSDPLPRGAGFSIVLVVLVDSCIMLVIGLMTNNLKKGVKYPTYWF